jgi:hypothetical protein
MALDPQLLNQALATPETAHVEDTPIVRVVILADPAHAAELAPWLEESGTRQSRNARRILCQFGATAVLPLLQVLAAGASAHARKEGIEIVWAMLAGEDERAIRKTLDAARETLLPLLEDRRPLPDDVPAYVERDFRGRVCDLCYLVVQSMLAPKLQWSLFRSLDDEGRNREIERFKQRGFGLRIS